MAFLSPPAAGLAAAGLLLVLLVPAAQAQLPTAQDVQDTYVSFALVCQQTLIEVDYQGTTQVPCTLYDLTHDYGGGFGTQPVGSLQHYTTISLGNKFPTGAQGWNVILGAAFIPTYGGDVVTFPITVQTTPQIDSQELDFEVIANYTGPNGEKLNQTIVFHAEVNQYDLAYVETVDRQKQAGQDEIVRYTIRIQNQGVYPDVYQVSVNAPAGYRVSTPPNVYVPPGESRNVTVSLLTPKGKLYELGRSEAFVFKVSSTRGTGVYGTVGLLKLSGPYLPSYWIPLLAVALVAGAITTTKARERAQMRSLERGRPRRVPLTPRQMVLLEELRHTDPEAYKQRKAQLAAIYAARRGEYRAQRKEQLRLDREERKVAKAEYAAARKRRALEREEQKRAEQLARKEALLQAKAEKREMKAKGGELRKKQKLLEKARKKQAKLDAKQAKVDAKAAEKAAKEQAKADKAAAKEAKRAAKAAKKQRPPEGNA